MYNYQVERPRVFTEDGQVKFLAIRDAMYFHCEFSGAVDFTHATTKVTGDSWLMIACVDRLVELGEFECVYDEKGTQDNIYKRTNS